MRSLPAALAALALGVPSAGASPPAPTGLIVAGGTGWHARNAFALTWSSPPSANPPLTSVHFRVRDPQGTTLSEDQRLWPADMVSPPPLPLVPGIYRAEVWFEDTTGAQGPAASAPLLFDNAQPAPTTVVDVPAWIGRNDLPLRIRLGHPAEPLPLSGIGGYAASVDRNPGGAPCAQPDRCAETETTLHGGIDDDELTLPTLPEGTSYLHVAAVSGAGMRSTASAHAVLHVDSGDPVTRLHGAPAGWTSQAVHLVAEASDSDSGMRADGGPMPFTAIQVDGGAPVVAPGERVEANVIAEGAHRIAYYARDAAGNVDDGASVDGVQDRVPALAWVRVDRTPPHLAFANSQDPDDPEVIRVRIADPLSGPDSTRGWIGARAAHSGDRFERLPALAAANGELRARWDSDAHPSGEYEFRAVGYDDAGNVAVSSRRGDGTAMILTSPLKATTTLRDSFGGGGPSRIVPYGRGALLHGRLTTGLSTALAGRPVRVVERFAPGAHPAARTSTVTTGPTGAFAIRVTPGPSRSIELAFAGSSTLAKTSGRSLELRVRSGVRLRTSAGFAKVGGPPVVFSGQVLAAPGTIPGDGVPVQLQFRLGHSPWSAFRTIQTSANGHFRYAYSFSDDDSRGATFQFRAYTPAGESWPYEPAGSRPVLVRGI